MTLIMFLLNVIIRYGACKLIFFTALKTEDR